MKKRMAAAALLLILVNAPGALAADEPIIVKGGVVGPPAIVQSEPSAPGDEGILSYLRTLLDGIYGISWGV